MYQNLTKQDLNGEVLMPGGAGYTEAGSTFMGSGSPAVIVRPRRDLEVAAAINYAVSNDVPLSVRSGGHSALGFGTNTDGVVIDLQLMNRVELVDGGNRLVRIGAGATWGDVATTLAPHGLGITAGDTTGVGVGGLTLGGGIGWMVRKHGLAIDNLVSAQVVTADGRILTASADENPDLFWALRGGGGNFGVVISFDFTAARVDTVHFGSITYQLDDAASLLRGWRDYMREAPDELSSTMMLMPGMYGAPESAMLMCCYAGDDDGAAGVIDPLLELGTVLESNISVLPYAEILEDVPHPPGVRMLIRNTLVRTLDNGVIDAAAEGFRQSGASVVTMRSLGGAVAGVAAGDTAFAHRDAEAMVIWGTFTAPDADDEAAKLALAPWETIAPFGAGAYVNFQGSAAAEDLASVYPPSAYSRLAGVKARYDPENVFRLNHNILPADLLPSEGSTT